MNRRHRHQWYQQILDSFPAIRREAATVAETLHLGEWRDRIGLYAGSSSSPGRLPSYVMQAIVAANREPVLPNRVIADEIRTLIKDVYGDDHDVVVTNTAEAALRLSYETLMAPPMMRKGDAYRTRVLTLLGEDFEWGAGYGRPFPPKYKNLAIDRTVAGGELGVDAKSLNNLDTLFVRFADGRYEVHGIKPNLVPLLTEVDPEATLQLARRVAERHATTLSGVHIVGYDTPGWGFGAKDGSGVPGLMRAMGGLAAEYDIPFVVDAATCLPIVGLDPRVIGADVMIYSMDKAGRSPIAGLAIGKADALSVLRKAMGWDGPRVGGTSSYSKAVFSLADPGRDSLVGLLAFLKVLRDAPERVIEPIEQMHDILMEELEAFRPRRFRDKLIITKSHHMGGIELNYARTWDGEEFGIPLFNLEDLYAETNAIDVAITAMGLAPSTIYAGNVLIGPGLGLIDEDGALVPNATRAAIRAMVAAFGIVCRHAGLGD